jgi:hypothetical protein
MKKPADCKSSFPCGECGDPCEKIKQKWRDKEMKGRDAVIKFLGRMSKIDRTGQDAGWAFECCACWDPVKDQMMTPCDVRVATRGEMDLVKAAEAAMLVLSGVEL